MLYEEIMNKMSAIKAGVFTRFTFKSELPVKAEFKKQGIRIEKVSAMTVRFGINYNNIASVIERKKNEEPKTDAKPRANNFVAMLANKVYFNTNTEKYYVSAFPTKKGTNTKSIYNITLANGLVQTVSVLPEEVKEFVQNSYWNKSEHNEMFRVSADNIISIGK